MNQICCFAKVGKQRRDSFAGWVHRGPGPSHRSNSEGEKAALNIINVIELCFLLIYCIETLGGKTLLGNKRECLLQF